MNAMDVDLIEEGAASTRLARRQVYDVIVIGGGQAGLSVGYHLGRTGLRFVILDAATRIGDAWRRRWDSLRLFTPAWLDGLDGMPFPGPRHAFPSKDEMADYLEAYAARFRLPVRSGCRVETLRRHGDRYVASCGGTEFEAPHVVVAMADFQQPKVPAFAAALAPATTQLHSSAYRGPSQLRPGGVLLVGAGNSGAEIAVEAARNGHPTWLAGRSTGEIPFAPQTFAGRHVVLPLLMRGVFHRLLTLRTPVGRRARPRVLGKATPLIRTRGAELEAAGVARVGRVVGARDGRPLLDDDRTLEVANVVWCSGYETGFDWIWLPVFDAGGRPRHHAGVVEGEPGLYFVGLTFLYAMSSSMVHGVGRDAERIVAKIAGHMAGRPTARLTGHAHGGGAHLRGIAGTERRAAAARSFL